MQESLDWLATAGRARQAGTRLCRTRKEGERKVGRCSRMWGLLAQCSAAQKATQSASPYRCRPPPRLALPPAAELVAAAGVAAAAVFATACAAAQRITPCSSGLGSGGATRCHEAPDRRCAAVPFFHCCCCSVPGAVEVASKHCFSCLRHSCPAVCGNVRLGALREVLGCSPPGAALHSAGIQAFRISV